MAFWGITETLVSVKQQRGHSLSGDSAKAARPLKLCYSSHKEKRSFTFSSPQENPERMTTVCLAVKGTGN